jgi:hypothetical protein
VFSKIPLLSLATAVCLLGLSSVQARPARSISASRQFIVYGNDRALCGVLGDVGERTKAKLLGLLHERDNWKTPIVVNAQLAQANFPEAPAVALGVSQTGFGLKLQLDLTIGADLQSARVERAFLRAVLVEMIYRGRPFLPAGTPYVEPPDWLIEGVLACAEFNRETETAQALSAALRSRHLISLEAQLRQNPNLLDSPSRILYRACCRALVQGLVDSRGGRDSLARFIRELPDASNDPLADLQLCFPALGKTESSAGKQWRRWLAQEATQKTVALLGVVESEQALDNVLRFRFPGAKKPERIWRLEQFAQFMHLPQHVLVLRTLGDQLMRLSGRVHPLLRPTVLSYEHLVASLAHGRIFGVARKLAGLSNARRLLQVRFDQVEDYMNWFEATQMGTRSGKFRDFLKVANEPAMAPRRRDSISVYLDALENQF